MKKKINNYISKHRDYFVLLLMFIFFLLTKLWSIDIGPKLSDENWYYYAGHLITKGIYPYKDFFLAHMPAQTYLYALIIRLFGFHYWVFRIFLIIVTISTSFLIYLKSKIDKRSTVGLIAASLFLFSLLVMNVSDFAIGSHEATFFLILAWYLLDNHPKLAGLSFFLGVSFRQYIAPIGAGIIIYEFIKKIYSTVINFIAYSIVPFIISNVVLYYLYGEAYLAPVWRYHFLKKAANLQFDVYVSFMKNSVFMIIFSIAAVILLLKQARKYLKDHRTLEIRTEYLDLGLSSTFAVAFQYFFFKNFSNVFSLYLVTVMPFLAILAGQALSVFLPKRSKRAGILVVITLSLMNIYFYEQYISVSLETKGYTDIVKDIKELTTENDKIFGSYIITPIIALETGRDIKEYEADINYQRFLANLITQERATKLATESAVFLQFAELLGPSVIDENCGGVVRAMNPAFVDYNIIRDNCRLYKKYPLYWLGHDNLLIWDCKKNR